MKRIILSLAMATIAVALMAQNVTLHAVDRPATEVFRELMAMTGKNFVYRAGILDDITVTVYANDRPFKHVLNDMFRGTGITYKIKGNDVILKRRRAISVTDSLRTSNMEFRVEAEAPRLLEELIVVSRLQAPAVESAEIGARKFTAGAIASVPTLLGEPDVIKTLHMEPGVIQGAEGSAGMYVHGGNADENLCMLDNIPLYNVNHFAGFFSAFNPDMIRYIDFYKSSVPAKFDGRLSSFMDVRTRNGSSDGHLGSAKLGLSSGAVNIGGHIGERTNYIVGLRRSWFDAITIPISALLSAGSEEKIKLYYYFTDFNAKLSHRFSEKVDGSISIYFGDDKLKSTWKDNAQTTGWYSDEKNIFHWGNLMARAGVNYRMAERMSAEFTAAYTRYFSKTEVNEYSEWHTTSIDTTHNINTIHNNINDWIFKADFDWKPTENSNIRFGANYVRHSFLPERVLQTHRYNSSTLTLRDTIHTIGANEANAYIEDDWAITSQLRANAGVHLSIFHIDKKLRHGISPRISLAYRPREIIAVKGAYTRTVQYVHQLTQSYLSLPTDRWVPITGYFKPQTTDKISVGAYWNSRDGRYAASIEGYWKWMHNLMEYRDDFYLSAPIEPWDAKLCAGKGSARGIDVKIEKTSGLLTWNAAYSLAWADRTFAGKNGGHKYPARFDTRHAIKLGINMKINDKVSLGAVWTGRSGHRFTLMSQVWEAPGLGMPGTEDVPLVTRLNSYRLPFYHRLDLACTVNNSRGYWTFGLYNAYCHLNTVAIRRVYDDNMVPVLQKVKRLPLIPSISYTWLF